MIEEAQRHVLSIVPVIGFIGYQLGHAHVDQAQQDSKSDDTGGRHPPERIRHRPIPFGWKYVQYRTEVTDRGSGGDGEKNGQ